MKHRCGECLHEFDDDGGPLPYRDRVHCVLCGAAVPLPRHPARTTLPPFSSEAAREADAALGVLSAAGSGFPDTLRQFRVRHTGASGVPRVPPAGGDSLAPLADEAGRDAAAAAAGRPWYGLPFWASLSAGFGVGALLAYLIAGSWRPSAPAAVSAAAAAAPAPSAPSAPSGGALRAAPEASVSPFPSAAPAVVAGANAQPPRRAFDPMAERRFALERARSEQRRYRLAAAEHLYRQVLARSPRDSEALAGLGELELLRGTTDLAAVRFQDALAANANYVPARIAVADLAWQAGHVEAARQAYREIVDSYAPDLYPPYVAQRSQVGAPPNCDP